MAIRSTFRKTEWTDEQRAEHAAIRERYDRERPGPDDLDASGEFDGPFPTSALMSFLDLLATLRGERIKLGLSLADVASRSGLDKAYLSRLESGKILNPTVATLWRYADAVGMGIDLAASRRAPEG